MDDARTDDAPGVRTTRLLASVEELGAERICLFMRHSAREYAPGRHDLENPLTEAGRSLAREFGLRLPTTRVLRAYASPVARCVDTAELIHAAHRERGGAGSGAPRPVEALGVFYVLDQMRMFKALGASGDGLAAFCDAWHAGRIPRDIMMPAADAASTLLAMLIARLRGQADAPALDLCVSHDMTLHLLRGFLFGRETGARRVDYLDGVALWERDGELRAAAHDVAPISVSASLATSPAAPSR